MSSDISEAIIERRLITFTYSGKSREVEPYCLGVSTAGNLVFRGFQIDGGSISAKSDGWKLFKIENISRLEILDEKFEIRSDYTRNDSSMQRIISQV